MMKTLFIGLLTLQVIFIFAFTANANSEEEVQAVNSIHSKQRTIGMHQDSFSRNHPVRDTNRIQIPSFEEDYFGSSSLGFLSSGQNTPQQNRFFVTLMILLMSFLFILQLIYF